MERPDFILNYNKPINTEIKHINGSWYLYERTNKWDKTNKRNKKISGKIIGKITAKEGLVFSPHYYGPLRDQKDQKDQEDQEDQNAPKEQPSSDSTAAPEIPALPLDTSDDADEAQLPYVPSTEPAEKMVQGAPTLIPPPFAPGQTLPDENNLLSDTVEVGAINYLATRSETMRVLLQKYFPDYWVYIYCTVLLRTVYHCPFRDLQRHFLHSVLCYVYDKIDLMRPALGQLLRILGSQRETIREYMLDAAHGKKQYVIVDGHRMLTSSKSMPLAELGYDSKHRYHPQLNVMYLFSTNGDGTFGTPSYYRQFAGSTIDSVALKDLINEARIGEDVILIGDKGTGSGERFEQIAGTGAKYIMPIKRGSTEVKALKEPQVFDPETMPGRFSYSKRSINYIEIIKSDYRLIIFLDMALKASENNTITSNGEKKITSEEGTASAAVEKLTSGVAKYEKTVQKKSDALQRAQESLERAMKQTKDAQEKVSDEELTLAKVMESAQKAADELDRRVAYGATSKRIEQARNSDAYQKRRVENHTSDLLSYKTKLQEKELLEEEARKNLEKITNELSEQKENLNSESAALGAVYKRLNMLRIAADTGLPVYDDGDDLALYAPDQDDFFDGGRRELGTLTIRTNMMDTPAPQIYRLYKLRQGIEQFFKTYDNTLSQDASYMDNQFSEEGWLFLNHLSATLAYDTMEQIFEAGQTKEISVRSWYSTLTTLQLSLIDGKWSLPSLKQDVRDRCELLGFNPTDLSVLGLELKN